MTSLEVPSLKVHKLLLEKKITNNITLATAESCTGGAFSASLVAHPDASSYFQGGVIAYSNRAKIELVGVLPVTLERFGAVSKEVADEMALGACKKFHATLGVAVSGILGPGGGTKKTPVGYVVASIAYNGKIAHSWTMQNEGVRQEILAKTVQQLHEKLALFLAEFRYM